MSIPTFRVLMSPDAGARVAEVLASGYIGQGARCEELERAFGEAVDAPEPPLFVNSCTSAIDLALHLCGVSAGDEVITTPITCTATNTHIPHRGALITWADVDPLTGNIAPASVAQLVTPRTKAVIAVDWAGRPCDYAALRKAAPGIPIIQDAAHGFLAKQHGRSIAHADFYGHFGELPHCGDYVCWSTQAIKHLTTGDGGFLLTPPEQMERARLLRWYGLNRRSGADFRCAQDIQEIGYKYQSNDIAAAIGLANLPLAREAVTLCRDNAAYYCRWLANLPGVEYPQYDPGCSYWLFTLVVADRPSFMAHLAEAGISTSQVHARNDKHSAFQSVSNTRLPLPGVDAFDAGQVAIPVGAWLTQYERSHIAMTVRDWSHRFWMGQVAA